MILGRVVGEVWATRKDPRLARAKLLLIRPHGIYEPAFDSRHLVAADDLDAGVGDDVIVCLGQPARRSLAPGAEAGPWGSPADAAVMAIVDRADIDDAAARTARAAPGIQRPLRRLAAEKERAR
jgi:ethanolamine utilization protein EutN